MEVAREVPIRVVTERCKRKLPVRGRIESCKQAMQMPRATPRWEWGVQPRCAIDEFQIKNVIDK